MIKLNSKICQSKEIEATDLNGEKVMMNIEKGKYFALNPVGSRIWEIISDDIFVDEIVKTLLKEYEIDKESCEKSVVSYLEILENDELITVC